jgi:ribosomal protein S18 acetylase RimI-like enzyme
MWIAPEARKQGVGVALVQAVVEWAESEKHRRIILDAANTNTAAIRLYESCGFVPTGKTGALPPPRDHILEHEMARIHR